MTVKGSLGPRAMRPRRSALLGTLPVALLPRGCLPAERDHAEPDAGQRDAREGSSSHRP